MTKLEKSMLQKKNLVKTQSCQCPFWDEYNKCCICERIEKIFRFEWEENLISDCLEEMP